MPVQPNSYSTNKSKVWRAVTADHVFFWTCFVRIWGMLFRYFTSMCKYSNEWMNEWITGMDKNVMTFNRNPGTNNKNFIQNPKALTISSMICTLENCLRRYLNDAITLEPQIVVTIFPWKYFWPQSIGLLQLWNTMR